jgi:hypothetical protein
MRESRAVQYRILAKKAGVRLGRKRAGGGTKEFGRELEQPSGRRRSAGACGCAFLSDMLKLWSFNRSPIGGKLANRLNSSRTKAITLKLVREIASLRHNIPGSTPAASHPRKPAAVTPESGHVGL